MKKSLMSVVACLIGTIWIPMSAYGNTMEEKECTAINPQTVASFFDRWNDALKTENPQQVTVLYAKDAVLLPTLSTKPRTNQKEILDYFKDFLKVHPTGKIDRRVIRYGSDWATDTGLYTFRIVEDGKPRNVEARYSFIYECINGQWLIVHQHSSLMPPVKENNNTP